MEIQEISAARFPGLLALESLMRLGGGKVASARKAMASKGDMVHDKHGMPRKSMKD